MSLEEGHHVLDEGASNVLIHWRSIAVLVVRFQVFSILQAFEVFTGEGLKVDSEDVTIYLTSATRDRKDFNLVLVIGRLMQIISFL